MSDLEDRQQEMAEAFELLRVVMFTLGLPPGVFAATGGSRAAAEAQAKVTQDKVDARSFGGVPREWVFPNSKPKPAREEILDGTYYETLPEARRLGPGEESDAPTTG